MVESPALLPDDAPQDWNQPFLNLVAECQFDAAPDELLDALKHTERELGRVERGRWAPRPIDIDILLWGRKKSSRNACGFRIRACTSVRSCSRRSPRCTRI